MFHSSTTIWHFPKQDISFYKENRRGFLILDLIRTAASTTLRTAGIVTRFAWNLATPIRYPFKIAWGGVKKGMEYVNTGVDYTEWGIRWTREAAKGVFYTGLGKSAFEIAQAPIDFVRYNLVSNTRTILGDILTLKTPRNIWQARKAAWGAIEEGVGDSKRNLKETFKNAISLSPLKTINSARKAVFSLLMTPGRAIGRSLKVAGETPIEVGTNIINSKLAYPKHLYKAPAHIQEGINRVKNAHIVASEEMEEEDRHHIRDFPIFLRDKATAIGTTTREKIGKWWEVGGTGAPAGHKSAATKAH